MENSSFSRLLDPRLFTFTVGTDESNTKDIIVHSGVIATHSSPISAMMNGDMHEAKMGRAHIPVGIETFQRFCEYVYFGGYTDPLPERNGREARADDDSPEVTEDESSLTADENSRQASTTRPVSRKHGKGEVHLEFTKQTYNTGGKNFIGYPILPWVLDKRNGKLTYCPRFCDHAQLYIFADKWQIPALKELVLYKLHAILKTVRRTEENLGNILDLVTLVFENTPMTKDRLRYLIVLYVVDNIDRFKSHPRFDQVISEGGDFACMVVTKMCEAMQ